MRTEVNNLHTSPSYFIHAVQIRCHSTLTDQYLLRLVFKLQIFLLFAFAFTLHLSDYLLVGTEMHISNFVCGYTFSVQTNLQQGEGFPTQSSNISNIVSSPHLSTSHILTITNTHSLKMDKLPNTDLAILYRASQFDFPPADTILVAQNCSFKVHSELLASKSPFFATALNGSFKVRWYVQHRLSNTENFQEATTKCIELEEDPWIVGRLVQFFYLDFYQYDHDDGTRPSTVCNGFSLDSLIKRATGADTLQFDEDIDRKRSRLDVMIFMFILADKYMIESLLREVIGEFENCFSSNPEESVVCILDKISVELMQKHTIFKEAFVRRLSCDSELFHNEKLRQRCLKDPDLAFTIAKAYAFEMEEWRSGYYGILDDQSPW